MALSQTALPRTLASSTEARPRHENDATRANSITVEGVGLTFLNGHVGLKATSLEIPGGAFCTLLGPSGSGKTTLLRTIAGLISPTSGRIFIDGKDVTNLPVQARNIGFVFQNYALFPHMSVAENIEYPLRVHKWQINDRRTRVKEILDLIELSHAADRAVGELSGGQQQRVAIGRALAYRPSLLLLDEPMGALDRRLRQQLGEDLREVQQRTGITAVYVTHDQEEAFILSDKVAIMDQGSILQYASPTELYFRPRSRFVAKFLGEANVIEVGALNRRDDGTVLASTELGAIPVVAVVEHGPEGRLAVVIRPEEIQLSTRSDTSPEFATPVSVTIKRQLFLGSRSLITVSCPNHRELLVECVQSQIPPPGQPCWITWRNSAAVLVDN
ncbi:ABC transporter ATP-binding protein [Pseudomonas sp. B21-056]|uniref:ABC transporter ATP-binding protein n=1 Tax=Pseudomonas sp. B21-056 TaxID=2895495 RepID=UPI00222E52AF|nr:ABC transporter ATP-binding protein [Pseudomonas sp. B21-056]UZE26367.1 ABC transporter ATP-binding protein [Pseudomonas sp. B21-056]